MSQVAQPGSDNPFVTQGVYSAEAVELMRLMRELRLKNGTAESSPSQVLSAVRSMGYRPAADVGSEQEVRLFLRALQLYSAQKNIAIPTCEDVLQVVQQLGYKRDRQQSSAADTGLPIDRRRNRDDVRGDASYRRSSTDLSPQQQMELTEEENRFLDELTELRNRTGRGFASSEELLSIVWKLGYRPLNEDGFRQEWLNDDERCQTQLAFSLAVETRLKNQADGEFLTCRDILDVVREIGFRDA